MGRVERASYRIDKVIFESQPQVHVTAHLYVPSGGKPPYPGVLAPLGHFREGKAGIELFSSLRSGNKFQILVQPDRKRDQATFSRLENS